MGDTIEAAERSPEQWGRIAVDLPGWEWIPGMADTTGARVVSARYGAEGWSLDIAGYWTGDDDTYPDPDDAATAGCLLAMLRGSGMEISTSNDGGPGVTFRHHLSRGWEWAPTLGRACIAAAIALGRWPGGDE